MEIAALIAWLLTAAGGFYLLVTWATRGGLRKDAAAAPTRLPAGVVFAHFLLAATGLVLWIIYLAGDSSGLAWASFVILLVVALLGFAMFFRWLGGRQGAAAATGAGAPEQHFPLAAVVGHGVLAATTLVLVLLAAASS
jgi:hypothetical protein